MQFSTYSSVKNNDIDYRDYIFHNRVSGQIVIISALAPITFFDNKKMLLPYNVILINLLPISASPFVYSGCMPVGAGKWELQSICPVLVRGCSIYSIYHLIGEQLKYIPFTLLLM